MRPSLPQRTSRASASQDRSDQQQQADSNTDLGRASHHYPASDPEGNGPGVAGRRDAAAAAAAAAATPRPLPTMEHGSEDEAEDDDSGGGGDEDERGDLPMSMTASVILTNLPKDASAALKDVEELDNRKVSIRFQPLGSAPILKQRVFKISASSKFSIVLNFLRKKVGAKPGDGLFLYVNSVFAPGLDESVGNLFRCFKTDDQLIVSYSTTPAFG